MENIIDYNNKILGIGEDVQKYVLNELKTMIENNNNMYVKEDIINDLENATELLKELETLKDSLVLVKEHPAGGFIVEELEVF